MGWTEFWAKQKENKRARTVARHKKRLTNKWQPTAERKRSMEVLYDLGTHQAIGALLKRFTFRTDGAIVDEDEKSMAFQRVLALGTSAIQPLIDFIGCEEAVYWPLRALVEIAGQDVAIDTLLTAVEANSGTMGAEQKRKEQLIANLREFDDERVFAMLEKCLGDEDEEVRFLASDGIVVFGARCLPGLVGRLADADETSRVKMQILEMLVEKKWKLGKKQKASIGGKIPEHYWIGDTGVVMRK